MVFERPDSTFSPVSSVHVRWYQLMFAAVVGDGFEEGLAGFIIKDVHIRRCVLGYKPAVEIVVRRNAMTVVL